MKVVGGHSKTKLNEPVAFLYFGHVSALKGAAILIVIETIRSTLV